MGLKIKLPKIKIKIPTLKDIGKSLSKAAPVLIPLAVTALTGGMGSGGWLGQIAKSTLGGSNLGAIGKSLLGGLTKGGLVKSLVDPSTTGEGGAEAGSGNILLNLAKKAAPALITRAIEGKPKSAQQEAQSIMDAASAYRPDPKAMSAMTAMITDNMQNPQKITPKSSGYSATPMTYGAPISFEKPAASDQNNQAGALFAPSTTQNPVQDTNRVQFTDPMAPVNPLEFMTGGDIGQMAAPVGLKKPRGYIVRGGR